MIHFNYETDFELSNEAVFASWISNVILSESKTEGEISYVFCDDDYLLKVNNQYLKHDTLTDIISFDYSVGYQISGDIFISTERVEENAIEFKTDFEEEMKRVMIHGILHYCGYRDKTDNNQTIMRQKEEEKMKMFHVEHS